MIKYKCPYCGNEMETEERDFRWDGRYALAGCFCCRGEFVLLHDEGQFSSLKIERPQ